MQTRFTGKQDVYLEIAEQYKEYIKKTEELYGDEADAQVREQLAKEHYVDGMVIPKEEELFFDFQTLQYFRAPMDEVVQKVEMEDGLECYIINMPSNGLNDEPWYSNPLQL